MKENFDIGLVCMMNYNLGNNLTNYALYCYLKDKGYRVGLIDIPYEGIYFKRIREKGPTLFFGEKPYADNEILLANDKWELYEKAENYHAYIVGSDQLWRDDFVANTDYFTMLNWVPTYKYKFSYATSIGKNSYNIKERDDYYTGFLLSRFNQISVRESSAKMLLWEKWKINSELVMDPVFMCDVSHYDELARRGMQRILTERYTAMYFLDVTKTKEAAGLKVANLATNGKYMAMTEIIYDKVSSDEIVYTVQPYVEEWIAMIRNSEFVITDSFHGMCLAIIYKKPFLVFFNKDNERGYSRFKDLLLTLNLSNRLIDDFEKIDIDEKSYYQIDYNEVYKIIDNIKSESMKWLNMVLHEMDSYEGRDDTYTCYLRSEYLRHNEEEKRARIFIAQAKKLRCISLKTELNEPQIVGWGAGNYFYKKADELVKKCNMKYVCDRNPDLWGKELVEGVKCISPQDLFQMDNVLVIIIAENIFFIEEIKKELHYMGIDRFECVDDFLM